jgi:hypothetical protein
LSIANQSTNDIIKQVLSQHIDNAIEAKKICDLFYGGNLYETSKNIWNFLKYQVPYKVEPSDKQTTKTLSRMLYDALNGVGNDCKHYAGFTGAVLDACGFKDWKYRFAGYSKYIDVPTHVYCIANDGDGIIYIDAVINGFDLEKPFILKIDKKIKKDMSLYKLSGVDDQNINGFGDWVSDTWNSAKKAVNQAADWAGDKARDAAQAIKEAALTASLVIPRNAFLGLIRLNYRGWADNLKNKTFDDLKWWKDWFGGNRTDFMDVIKAGAKESRLFGTDENLISGISGIGEPVTTASLLASASVIVGKVYDILEKAEKIKEKADNIKDKGEKIYNQGKEFYDQGKKDLEKANNDIKNATGIDPKNIIWKKDSGSTQKSTKLSIKDIKKLTDAEARAVADGFYKKAGGKLMDNKTLLIAGGVGVAAFLILKNK